MERPAEETIETLTQENFELKARLKELETLVEQLQPLLSLKDDELAAYQDQLAIKADRTAIEEESESTKVIVVSLGLAGYLIRERGITLEDITG